MIGPLVIELGDSHVFRRLCFVMLCALLSLVAVPSLAHAAPGDVTITAPGDDGEDQTPLIQGTADPSLPVHVTIDGVEVASVTPEADGTWEFQVTEPAKPGTSVNIEALVLDESEMPIGSAFVSYYVWEEPSVITVVSPTQGDAIGPSYAVAAEVTGLAFLDDRISLLFDGEPVADPIVQQDDSTGELQFLVEYAEFTDGPHTVQIVAEDRHGRDVQSEVIKVIGDTTPPSAPVVTSHRNGDVITDRTPTFAGTVDPGASVSVRIEGSGEPVCEVAVDTSGHWTCQPTGYGAEVFANLEGQLHELTIIVGTRDQVDNIAYVILELTVDYRKPSGGTGTTTPTPTPTPTDASPTPTSKPSPTSSPVALGSAGGGSNPPGLAYTGADPTVPLLVAGLLILGGFGLRRVSRSGAHA